MAQYNNLSKELQNRIQEDRKKHLENPFACNNGQVIRRDMDHDKSNLWRPSFIRDIEKIIHVPYYNRYCDKTQVFSFYKNDDISRRALHVQLVSRIARNIGGILNLNTDLIEAIALGHDMGHTPFGHPGERMLSKLLYEQTGRYFNHNVHSVRVLDQVMKRNISLQTLDGVLCHNGELEQDEYHPSPKRDFAKLDELVEQCYQNEKTIESLVPSTLEACVVRICDIIAYLGKDRQDAQRINMITGNCDFTKSEMGKSNAEIINNLVVNILENSYGKGYLKLDDEYFKALKEAKKENYKKIYGNESLNDIYDNEIEPMFRAIYEVLLKDAKEKNQQSILFKHHVKYVMENNYGKHQNYFEVTEANQLVVDFIASMTDDYFIDLYHHLFPQGKHSVKYIGYFQEESQK